MNTIPRKIANLGRDTGLALTHVLRKRPFTVEEPKFDFKSLETDMNALDSLSYYMLGMSVDTVLDIIYEKRVPTSNSNPLLCILIVIVAFHIPSILVFVEVIGAVPGKGTLYCFAYVGFNEMIAFICGWVWIGAAAARQATILHYYVSGLLYYVPGASSFPVITDLISISFLVTFPLASKNLSVNINILGLTFKVALTIFLLGYVKTANWFINRSEDSTSLVVSVFNYLPLYFNLPMVSPLFHNVTRTKILINKAIALSLLAAVFHLIFFLILTGNVPYTYETKPWVENIIKHHRPLPYRLIFVFANYISGVCGLFALMNTTTEIIHQMSLDGVLFNFLSSSDDVRKIFFSLVTYFLYLDGFSSAQATYIALSSLGMLLAGFCVLYVKSTGSPGFYNLKHPRQKRPKGRSRRKKAFIEAVVKSMLIFVVLGCLLGSFVGRKLFIDTDTAKTSYTSYNFALLMISLCFVGVALIILTVTPSYRSVHAKITCPLGPYIPIILMLSSSVSFALNFHKAYLAIILWVVLGFLLYLLFGIRNVTNKLTSEKTSGLLNEPEEKLYTFRFCHEREDWKICDILKKRYQDCKEKFMQREREALTKFHFCKDPASAIREQRTNQNKTE